MDSDGIARLLSTGETTITCTAVNGVSNSMVLHVYDPEETPVQKAESLQLELDSSMLFPGEYNQAVATVSPQPAKYSLEYESSDEGVATVDAYGIVKAVAPGTCEITVTDSKGGLTANLTVTVIDPDAVAGAKDELACKLVFGPCDGVGVHAFSALGCRP